MSAAGYVAYFLEPEWFLNRDSSLYFRSLEAKSIQTPGEAHLGKLETASLSAALYSLLMHGIT